MGGLVRAAALVVGALETVYAFAQGPAHTVWLSAGRGYHPLRRSPKRGAQLQTGSHGTRFAAAQLQMNSVVSCDGDQDARIATERWLDEWVVGLRLCPWAMASSREPQMKLLVVEEGASEIEAHIALVEGEARALEERVRCTANVNRAETEERTAEAPFTTLLVFPGDGYQEGGALECGAFPKLARRCEEAVRRFDQDMLAFHPNRVDHGPGCSEDEGDAAHFSVRSPFPTLQLLRRADLAAARDSWAAGEAAQHDRRGAVLPGALGLLTENKRRLRGIGSRRLGERLGGLRGRRLAGDAGGA